MWEGSLLPQREHDHGAAVRARAVASLHALRRVPAIQPLKRLATCLVIAAAAGVGCRPTTNADCRRKDEAAEEQYQAARRRLSAVRPGSFAGVTDAIGEALDCDDEICTQGPCARCYWIYQGCSTVGRIYVTVEKWGTPLDVRNGSRVLGLEYLDR